MPDGDDRGPRESRRRGRARSTGTCGYDANGNPVERTDPRGVTVVSTFGVLDRLESIRTRTTPGCGPAYPYPLSTAYAYDGNGNVDLVTERKRTDATTVATEVTDPAYDGLGRLWTETRYDGKILTYEYDPKGNRKKVTDPDRSRRSTATTRWTGSLTATTPAGTATYRYWPDGLPRERRCRTGSRRRAATTRRAG